MLATDGANSLATPTDATAATLAIVQQLWPSPHRVSLVGPGLRSKGLAMVPNARRPTRLIPDQAGRASAAVLAGTVNGASWQAATRRRALATSAWLGMARFAPRRVAVSEVPGAPSVLTYLADVFDTPITAAIHVGPPRANRKPVLHLVGHNGRTVAYAKIGINDLTRSLVSAETDALCALAAVGLRQATIPRVIHEGSWQDLQVLCLAPVSTRSGGPVPPSRLQQAMVEVAAALGTDSTTVADSPHLLGVRDWAADTSSIHGAALVEAIDRLVARHGDVRLTTGAWHGDWTPWNMGFAGDELSVWDWERLETGVPLGLDALHFAVQRAMRVPGSSPGAVAEEQVAARRRLLAPWGYDAVGADVATAVYLLTIGARYAADDQESAGARLGRLGEWLLPALETLIPPVAGSGA